MAEELTRSLLALADRGQPRGAETVLEEARRIVSESAPVRRRVSGPVAAFVAAAVILVVIGVVVAAIRWAGLEAPPVVTIPTSTSTTAAATPPTTAVQQALGLGLGWEDLGTLSADVVFPPAADTGSVAVASSSSGFKAIDLETGAVRTVAQSPMCDGGTLAGIWAGGELFVWSTSPLDSGCPFAAVYAPESDQWRVLNSGVFREVAGSQVVWTGTELVSTNGLAYRPDTGGTRQVAAVDESPMFNGDSMDSPPLMHWTGSVLLALGSEGVITADLDGGIVDGPAPPISQYGRTSVWTGDRLLAVSWSLETGYGLQAAMFDPTTNRWEEIDSVPSDWLPPPCWGTDRRPPDGVAGRGLVFIQACFRIVVWDGSGEWKRLPPSTLLGDSFDPFEARQVPHIVVGGGYVYSITDRILRHPLPELIDGQTPQPFLPIGYLESEITTSGIYTWAGNSTDIWSYSEGSWSHEASLPSGCFYVQHASDTFWINCEHNPYVGLYQLDNGEWRRPESLLQRVGGQFKTAPGSAALWWSDLQDLYRWDGVEVTNLGHPPGHSYLGRITATTDGTIWADGYDAWAPWSGGVLARYDPHTHTWETVRPLGGPGDLPAEALAPSSDGGLWALLYDWPDSTQLYTGASDVPTWALAHLDGATGEWTVYDENLPAGFPTEMVSDDEAVWLFDRYTSASRESGFRGTTTGLLRFDGRTWTTYLADTTVDDAVIAGDGTVWYLAGGQIRLRRLEDLP